MSIRRQELSVTDQSMIENVLLTSRVGYLGLVDGDEPYVVPLNFIWYRNQIYFHGAEKGRKAILLAKNPMATFTVSQDQGTIANPVPGETDTAYISVMIFGKTAMIHDFSEKAEVLNAMLSKYVPGYYEHPLHPEHVKSYISNAESRVAVYRLATERVTAKEHNKNMDMMFYPGRTQKGDVLKMRH